MFLAKPQRRKERKPEDLLCGSASWRETVFRISVDSVDGVSWEESVPLQIVPLPDRSQAERYFCRIANIS
jgi:hypothetical protein